MRCNSFRACASTCRPSVIRASANRLSRCASSLSSARSFLAFSLSAASLRSSCARFFVEIPASAKALRVLCVSTASSALCRFRRPASAAAALNCFSNSFDGLAFISRASDAVCACARDSSAATSWVCVFSFLNCSASALALSRRVKVCDNSLPRSVSAAVSMPASSMVFASLATTSSPLTSAEISIPALMFAADIHNLFKIC